MTKTILNTRGKKTKQINKANKQKQVELVIPLFVNKLLEPVSIKPVLFRSVGAQYHIGGQWRKNSR